jgi:hypothetical protein
MKKYFLLFAVILFLCNSGFSQVPVEKIGAVTVDVVKHLEITLVDEPNQFFTYNEANPEGLPPTNQNSSAVVTLKANVNWKFSIVTQNNATVLVNKTRSSETINANIFTYAALGTNGTILISGTSYQPLGPTCATPIKGSMNSSFKLYWKVSPKFSGNLYAGDYFVGISYLLAEQ